MNKEIERKYLLKNDNWKGLAEPVFYRQGYLSYGKGNTVRIRTINDKGIITIKSKTVGISRDEFEYEIPFDDAEKLLDQLCAKPLIEKFRTKIKIKDLIWEVDEFVGDNKGLVVAEVELHDENQKIEMPEWIGKEVSGKRRYYNSSLIKNPYKKWSAKN
jgi:adenylate cyclase